MIYAIVAVILAIAILAIRYSLRGAIMDRLPIEPDEQILCDEENRRVFHRVRDTVDGRVLMYKVRLVLTNRRILIATGGPEGKHKFLIRYIVEHRGTHALTPEEVGAARAAGYGLDKGYATYRIGAADVALICEDGQTAVRILVPYTVDETFQLPPRLVLYTARPEVYRGLFAIPEAPTPPFKNK